MTTAPPQDQRQLLAVQALDSRIDQNNHRRAHLPEVARLAEVTEQLERAEDAAATADAEASDIQRELVRYEDEIAKVRSRQDRDRERLESGNSQAKELRALQQELEALDRRRASLEDTTLEVMEHAESANAVLDRARAAVATLTQGVAAISADVDQVTAEIEQDNTALAAERADLVKGLDAKLVELYERLRRNHGGIGAAEMVARRCGGCRLEINAAELAALRKADPAEVLRCDECGRIMVRTPNSGLS